MIHIRLLSVLAFSLLLFQASAADGDWSVSKIDPRMLKNANVVIRLSEEQITMKNPKEYVYRFHYVYTILNENGDDMAVCNMRYDKLSETPDIEGTLFDAAGKAIKSLKSKDIQDMSAVSGNDLFDDDRMKVHSFYYKVYPYTVEYEVTQKFKTTFYLPSWAPVPDEKTAVEKSNISYTFPETYELRFKTFNYPSAPKNVSVNGMKTLTWAVESYPAFLDEPFQPALHEITPFVSFAPSVFEMGGIQGNMNSWLSYGAFQLQLNKGRDQLPDVTKQKVHSLTDGVADPREKIRILYEYMQQNTRYISIQLGVGGWQPFEASYVATKGYGDCKALSNFMYSLLKEAGIRSCYTIIRAGKNAKMVNPDFPSTQFNHIILAVPMQKDTVWLECTSQTLPAGYLSSFTCDRDALLVDADGGKLVHTPQYKIDENLEIRNISAVLDPEGTLTLKSSTRYGGLQQDHYHQLIHQLSKDKIKDYLREQLDFSTYEITSFDYKEALSAHPHVDETLDISVSNYATVSGKRLFIIPNIMTRNGRKLAIDTARKFGLELGSPYRDIDTVSIRIPAGYAPESMPADVSIRSVFGTYTCSVKLKGDQLQYFRSIDHFGGRFPATQYNDLVKYFEAVYKADRNKVVLVKNTTN